MQLFFALVLLVLLGAAPPAHAQTTGDSELVYKLTPEQFAEILSKAGFYSSVEKTDKGEAYVLSSQFFLRGATVAIPGACEADGCAQYTFVTYLKPKADWNWITDWNLQLPGLVKAALRADREDLLFETSVPLAGGVTRKHIAMAAFAYATLVTQRFEKASIRVRQVRTSTPAAPAPSPTQILERVTPQQMAEIMNRAGYPSTIQQQGNKTFVVAKFYPTVSGQVGFEGCNEQGCNLVYFLIYLGRYPNVGQAWANKWNLDKTFVTAVVKDSNLGMVMWSHLFGGVTADNLAKRAQLFVQIMDTASDFKP